MVPLIDGFSFIKSVTNRKQDGDIMYYLINEGLLYSINTHTIRKNFVLEKRISNIIERIRQAHLLDKFISESLFQARQLSLLSKEQRAASEQNKKVTMESLKSAFALLLVGYSISLITFAYELRRPVSC